MTSIEHDPLVGYLETWVELRGCTQHDPCVSGPRYTVWHRCWRHVRAHRLATRWARLRRRRMTRIYEACKARGITCSGL